MMSTGEAALIDPDWKYYFILGFGSMSFSINANENAKTVSDDMERAAAYFHKIEEAALVSPLGEPVRPPRSPCFIFSTGSMTMHVKTDVKAATLKKDWAKAEAIYHYLLERGLIGPIELPHK